MQAIDAADDPLMTQPLGRSLQAGRVAQNPAPNFDPGSLSNSWNDWVNKPNNRAALAQFGIAMLQPLGMGETGMGHFGNAVGAAGQAAHHVTEQEQAERKSQTEAELRESKAYSAERMADAATTRAALTGQNTDLRAENARVSNLAKTLQAQARARSLYDKYLTDPLRTGKELSYPEWLKTPDGAVAISGGGGEETPGASALPASPAAPEAGHLTADEVYRHPNMQADFANIKRAAASGDPATLARAKAFLQQKVAPYMSPAEMARLNGLLGIR